MSAVHLRMLGHVVTMVMHISNMVYMMSCFRGPVMDNAYVKHFSEMQCFFFTCWTFTMQTVYSGIALYSDHQVLKNSKSYELPKLLVNIREAFFTILVWPSTMLTATVFWSMFILDRNLLYPADIDQAIPLVCNHIMHSYIVVATMWEAAFRPRVVPEKHLLRYLCVLGVEATYIVTLLAVYIFKGVWVYPIFGLLIGSVYFYLFFVGIAAWLFVIYHAQWTFNNFVWGQKSTGCHGTPVWSYAQKTLNTLWGSGKKVE